MPFSVILNTNVFVYISFGGGVKEWVSCCSAGDTVSVFSSPVDRALAGSGIKD